MDTISANDLALRCAAGAGAEEWNEFVHRFTRPIARSVLRVARQWGERSPAVIDDIVQDILLKFCEDDRRLLREFEPRFEDSFLAYVRVVSVAQANDYFRRRNSQKRGDGQIEEELTEFHAPVLSTADWMDRNILLEEIDQLLESNSEGTTGRLHRTIFWLHHQQGMTAKAIASLPEMPLSVKGVESALHRMLGFLRDRFRAPGPQPMPLQAVGFSQAEGFSRRPTVQQDERL